MSKLFLIPSSPEMELFQRFAGIQLPADCHVESCGVGLVASAAETSRLLVATKPDHVVLIGVAGSLNDPPAVGTALMAAKVFQQGMGAGEADRYQSMQQLGFHRFASNERLQTSDVLKLCLDSTAASDRSGATENRSGPPKNMTGSLLSVAAASIDAEQADRRKRYFPDARAEDMESYAVAFACRRMAVPLTVIRGISNVAGNRNHAEWDLPGAMQAACRLAGFDC